MLPTTKTIHVAIEGEPQPCRMAYLEWENADVPVVVCVHGLTRNAHDFSYLADALHERYRILSIDMPGRGQSDWLENHEHYTYGTYLSVIQQLLASLNISEFFWVGTSMGGIIGMIAAGLVPQSIKGLVLNDVGPFIPANAIKRLSTYVGKTVSFNSREEAENALRTIYQTFGIHEQSQWQHLFQHGLYKDGTGKIRLTYDPMIGKMLEDSKNHNDVDMWEMWPSVQCPVLLLRGETSDILTKDTADKMADGHNALTYKEIPDVGHAPSLMQQDEIAAIINWLDSQSKGT